MAETIHVELARAVDGADLLEALAARGLSGELVETRDSCAVEISYARDEQRLRGDVELALDTWLAERRLPLIPMRTGRTNYVLRPHSS